MSVTLVTDEYATLADQRVKVNDLTKMVAGFGKYTSSLLSYKYPGILKTTFDHIKTRMTP
jgi:hypothetical protein